MRQWQSKNPFKKKKKNKRENSSNVNYDSASIVLRRLTLTHANFFPPVCGLVPFLELILFAIVLPSRFATLANLSRSLLRIVCVCFLSFSFVFSLPRSFSSSLSLSLVPAVKLDRQTEKCIYERNV